MKLIGVSACPTGVAHTYMAAEAMEMAAKELGHEMKVETQGSMGIENELTPAEIAAADGVIFAVDLSVARIERFNGKIALNKGVSEVIKHPRETILEAVKMVEEGGDTGKQVYAEKSNNAEDQSSPEKNAGENENCLREVLFGWLKRK